MGNGRRTVWWVVATCVLLMVVGLVATAKAARSETTKRVTFHGYRVEVPVSWPVVDLARNPTACVRFDVHAVYLGHPGADQSCPAHLVGRTEALLIEPLDKTSKGRVRSDTVWAPKGTAAATIPAPTDQEVTVGVTQAGVLVTGSYGDDRATLADVIGGATLTRDARPATELASTATTATTVLLPGTFNGKGFDACTAPSPEAMQTWLEASPYRAANIYIGGVARACEQPMLTAEWVSQQTSAGWALIPTYVGLQAPCGSKANKIDPANAPAQGRQNAEDAAVQAGALGIGPGSVIYFDMEGYSTTDPACTQTVLTFLSNWSTRLHELGYLSGVYSSVSSGIRDLVSVYDSTSFVRPDHIWLAHWGTAANTSDPVIPDTFWANHQRIKQYQGGHDERWPDVDGGVTINIDNDFLDVETPAPPPPPPVDDGDQNRPAVVTLGSEVHVFARGTDNRVYEAFYRPGAWSSWAAIGNLTTQGSPAAVVYGTGINLFARGTDQRLWESYYRPGKGWSGWGAHTGLSVAGDPSAVIYGTSGINVFIRGTDQRLYETFFRPTTRWSGWGVHAGVSLAGDPATVVLGTEVHVFARGVDGGLYETFYRTGFGWSAWLPHAGVPVDGDPAVVVWGTGLNLFVRGTDQRLHETYLRSNGWSSWKLHGGAALAGDPAAVVVSTELHVFARTTANLMAETFYRSGVGWSDWASHGSRTIAGTPAVVRYGTSGINVFARGTDHHLYETYFRPASGWSAWHVRGGTAVAIA